MLTPGEAAWDVEGCFWWCDADAITGLVVGFAAGLQPQQGCPRQSLDQQVFQLQLVMDQVRLARSGGSCWRLR